MDKQIGRNLLFIAIGALLLAYLLHRVYRAETGWSAWPTEGWFDEERPTINHPDNV